MEGLIILLAPRIALGQPLLYHSKGMEDRALRIPYETTSRIQAHRAMKDRIFNLKKAL